MSLGTNDLAQYRFAADRLLGELADRPRLVAQVGTAGAGAGKPVGVCGEAAGDPLLAPVLVGLGVTGLSMAPTAVAEVRLALSRCTSAERRAPGAGGAGARQPDARAARHPAAGAVAVSPATAR